MDREDVIEQELKQLNKTALRYAKRVEDYLQVYQGKNVRNVMLYLSEGDQLRLLTLRAWEMKYKVSLKFILSTLLPFWQSFLKNKTKKISRGLGVRISTLTGKKSEQILRDAISRTYPDNENVLVWMAERREEIIQCELERMHTGIRIKSLLKFSSPQKYFRHYQNRIQEEALLREQIEDRMKKFNYRDNPFRSETCFNQQEE
jgi:hypothetical protein